MNFADLTKKIEESEIITIYRHEHPDCDAYGSAFGLREWIRDNWPGKKVCVLGKETCSQGRFPVLDEADDDTVASSLAIVCDTANTKRIDDKRALTAQYVIKIDHHPNNEPYGDLMLVNEHAAAACEVLTEYFRSQPEKKVSLTTAEYLYQGLLTDTLNFSTSNTSASTLECASFLASKGVRIPELNRELFDRTLQEFRFRSYLCSRVQMADPHVAYVILREDELREWGISAGEARPFVSELGHVKDFEVWAVFTEETAGRFAGSLRAKTAAVNEVAAKYGGGGHKVAAGVKNLTEETMQHVIDLLVQCYKES